MGGGVGGGGGHGIERAGTHRLGSGSLGTQRGVALKWYGFGLRDTHGASLPGSGPHPTVVVVVAWWWWHFVKNTKLEPRLACRRHPLPSPHTLWLERLHGYLRDGAGGAAIWLTGLLPLGFISLCGMGWPWTSVVRFAVWFSFGLPSTQFGSTSHLRRAPGHPHCARSCNAPFTHMCHAGTPTLPPHTHHHPSPRCCAAQFRPSTG